MRPIACEDTKQIGILLERKFAERIKKKAIKRNTNVSDVIRSLLEMWDEDKISIKRSF